MAARENRITTRRAVLAHWLIVPGCYLLLRLSHADDVPGFDLLLLGALLGLSWLTVLAYIRWVSPVALSGMLIALDLFLSTLILALVGDLRSDFYVLYGLILLLVAFQLTGVWVLITTLIMTALSVGLVLWTGPGAAAAYGDELPQVLVLIGVGLVAWLYDRQCRVGEIAGSNAESQRLAWFQQIGEQIRPQTNSEKLCEFAVLMARQISNADVGGLLILDEHDDAVGRLYTSIENESIRKSTLTLNLGSAGLCDRLIREGRSITEQGPGLDLGSPSLLTYYPPVQAFLGIPFKRDQHVFGALFVANRHGDRGFLSQDQVAIAFLGTQVSMALDNRRLLHEVRERFTSTIEALVTAIEAKHPYTRGHSEQVIKYAVAIAQDLDLSNEEVETIRVAAALHDIGKIGVPEGVLDKAGTLTARERASIMSHPNTGARIVEALDPRGDILYMIYYHHENYDGSGYPKGLKGDQIPLGARILRVADAFEAMISDRPYQRTRSRPEALRELRAGAGRQFDPAVVDAFARASRRLADEQAQRGRAREHLVSQISTTPGK